VAQLVFHITLPLMMVLYLIFVLQAVVVVEVDCIFTQYHYLLEQVEQSQLVVVGPERLMDLILHLLGLLMPLVVGMVEVHFQHLYHIQQILEVLAVAVVELFLLLGLHPEHQELQVKVIVEVLQLLRGDLADHNCAAAVAVERVPLARTLVQPAPLVELDMI
jgi:hypothetical protein